MTTEELKIELLKEAAKQMIASVSTLKPSGQEAPVLLGQPVSSE